MFLGVLIDSPNHTPIFCFIQLYGIGVFRHLARGLLV
nr:MAG TPA: hypothetical protein [Caudoviricetes sp.]